MFSSGRELDWLWKRSLPPTGYIVGGITLYLLKLEIGGEKKLGTKGEVLYC